MADYSCFMLVDLTIFVMFIIGFVFLFNIATEWLGFVICGFAHILLFTTITFNVLRKQTEDMLAFSVFSSVGLSFVSILLCIMFYMRINVGQNTFLNPSILDGQPRTIFTTFKGLYVSALILSFILYGLYLYMNTVFKMKSSSGVPFVVETFFVFMRGDTVTSEHIYTVVASILALAVLGISSYTVFETNKLNSIQVLT
jgi:hypothetical protein